MLKHQSYYTFATGPTLYITLKHVCSANVKVSKGHTLIVVKFLKNYDRPTRRTIWYRNNPDSVNNFFLPTDDPNKWRHLVFLKSCWLLISHIQYYSISLSLEVLGRWMKTSLGQSLKRKKKDLPTHRHLLVILMEEFIDKAIRVYYDAVFRL